MPLFVYNYLIALRSILTDNILHRLVSVDPFIVLACQTISQTLSVDLFSRLSQRKIAVEIKGYLLTYLLISVLDSKQKGFSAGQ